MSVERCKGYCGVACVDGSCPKANIDEYIEYNIPVIRTCDDCHYYEGCDDCCFYYTDMCVMRYDND